MSCSRKLLNLKKNREAELADPRVWWEYMKYSIRKFCQNYSKKAERKEVGKLKNWKVNSIHFPLC